MQRPSIEHVTPLCITTPVDGVEVTVRPITVGQYPALLQHLTPLLETFTQAPTGLFDRASARQAGGEDLQWLAGLCFAHADDVLAVVAVSIGQPREWVAGLLPDRFLDLVLMVLEVNADFFTRAQPTLRLLWARARAALPAAPTTATASAGPTPSAS